MGTRQDRERLGFEEGPLGLMVMLVQIPEELNIRRMMVINFLFSMLSSFFHSINIFKL